MKKLYPNLLLILSVAIFGLLPLLQHMPPQIVLYKILFIAMDEHKTQAKLKCFTKTTHLQFQVLVVLPLWKYMIFLAKKLLTIKTSLFKEYLTEISLLQRIQFLLFPLKRLHSISPLRSFQSKSL